jgi:hypothetical protein
VQTEVIERSGTQLPGQTMDFSRELIDDCLQPLPEINGRRPTGKQLLQRLKTQIERGGVLPYLIVQFVRDAPPLLLLRRSELLEQLIARYFGLLTFDDFRIRVSALSYYGGEDEDRHRLDA